jgi:hypothetical protein
MADSFPNSEFRRSEFFFVAVVGLELRAFTLRHTTSPIFVKGFSRQGFLELFAQAGFKPPSS